MSEKPSVNVKAIKPVLMAFVLIFALAVFSAVKPFTTVQAGHVGVASLFGNVDDEVLPEGFHIINPLKKVIEIDCRNKQLTLEKVGVPSQDQLTTQVDITVKWRVNKLSAADAYRETGTAQKLEETHLVPKVRSLIREAGKSVERAESFYKGDVQTSMQAQILAGLQEPMKDKGILIDDVLMRAIKLPTAVEQGVLRKKEQEQKAEQQKAEFERYKTEQKQLVAAAEAQRNAALEEAEKRKALADAKAYEIVSEAEARAKAIKIEGDAIRNNPALIQLRKVEKWKGDVPRVSLGSNVTPLIDISAEAQGN